MIFIYKTFSMKKVGIKEERLEELIKESIYEILAENESFENIGHWLGRGYQGMKNMWNNFKNDFEAGVKKGKYDNRNYDSFSNYGDNADNIRNFNRQNSNQNAQQYTGEKNTKETTTQNAGGQTPPTNDGNGLITPHPCLSDDNQQQGQEQVQQKQNNQQQASINNTQRLGHPSNIDPKVIEKIATPNERKRIALDCLSRAGIIPQTKNDYRNFIDKNSHKRISPDQRRILGLYNKFLLEDKLHELKQQLNEIKNKTNKKSRK